MILITDDEIIRKLKSRLLNGEKKVSELEKKVDEFETLGVNHNNELIFQRKEIAELRELLAGHHEELDKIDELKEQLSKLDGEKSVPIYRIGGFPVYKNDGEKCLYWEKAKGIMNCRECTTPNQNYCIHKFKDKLDGEKSVNHVKSDDRNLMEAKHWRKTDSEPSDGEKVGEDMSNKIFRREESKDILPTSIPSTINVVLEIPPREETPPKCKNEYHSFLPHEDWEHCQYCGKSRKELLQKEPTPSKCKECDAYNLDYASECEDMYNGVALRCEKEPTDDYYPTWLNKGEMVVSREDLERNLKRLEHFLDVNRRGAFPYPGVYVDWDNDLRNDKKKYLGDEKE